MTHAELEAVIMPQLDKLYRVARRMAPGSAKAEDLVGSTLLTAFKNAHQCDGSFPFAWLVQIMRNQWLHEVRRRKPESDGDEALAVVIDAKAHHRFLERVNELDVIAALDKLPDEYRLAVALCDMEELDYNEAAAALGVPVGTIRSRLSRGRKLLQQHLAGWSVQT